MYKYKMFIMGLKIARNINCTTEQLQYYVPQKHSLFQAFNSKYFSQRQ